MNNILGILNRAPQHQETRANLLSKPGISSEQITAILNSPYVETVSKGSKSDKGSTIYRLTNLGAHLAKMRNL